MTAFSWFGERPAGFISPHLDDAVLSCAGAIGVGSTVVTVFSAGPKSVDPLPAWDRLCGCFEPGDDVPAIRSQEDEDALRLLGARGTRLGFWALQYRSETAGRLARLRTLTPNRTRTADAASVLAVSVELGRVIGASALDTWFIPLGVGHDDHKRVNAAALALARENPQLRWVAYEDLPYSRESPSGLIAAHDRVSAAGFGLEEMHLRRPADEHRKRQAVSCYRSQLAALGERVDVAIDGPERYYLLVDDAAAKS